VWRGTVRDVAYSLLRCDVAQGLAPLPEGHPGVEGGSSGQEKLPTIVHTTMYRQVFFALEAIYLAKAAFCRYFHRKKHRLYSIFLRQQFLKPPTFIQKLVLLYSCSYSSSKISVLQERVPFYVLKKKMEEHVVWSGKGTVLEVRSQHYCTLYKNTKNMFKKKHKSPWEAETSVNKTVKNFNF
jgi:hypothetical protein